MENNLDNKAKFFAQYWGQIVYKEWSFEDSVKVNGKTSGVLHLKNMAEICNEDAIEVCVLLKPTVKWDSDNKMHAIHFSEWHIKAHQLLVSKGYALPFMGISVNQLIEYGWIKLNQPPATV